MRFLNDLRILICNCIVWTFINLYTIYNIIYNKIIIHNVMYVYLINNIYRLMHKFCETSIKFGASPMAMHPTAKYFLRQLQCNITCI